MRTHLLPHGGTDLIGPSHECLLRHPPAWWVLTSSGPFVPFDRVQDGVSSGVPQENFLVSRQQPELHADEPSYKGAW